MNDSHVRFARWVSIIGHPFLLMPLLTGIIAYHVLPPKQALIAEIVALCVVIIPAGLFTIVRVRRGRWGDLDVSNPRERGQFYGLLLPLLGIVTIIAWAADVPHAIPLGSLAIIVLVGLATLINSRMKISLHTGFGIFAALTLFLVDASIATPVLVLACLVAWSRVILGRHTKREVLFGGGLGLAVAAALSLAVRHFN